jgi:hypothetical protein
MPNQWTGPSDLSERFWSKVNRTDTCWLWTAGVDADGYGRFNADWKGRGNEPAHRVAFRLVHGREPGPELCHKCGVAACVRPDERHVYEGTRSDNERDKVAHGRHHHAKKTHCPKGHPYSGKNLYVTPSTGDRLCRACQKEQHRVNYHRRKHGHEDPIRPGVNAEFS